jgi:hypothetical protein
MPGGVQSARRGGCRCALSRRRDEHPACTRRADVGTTSHLRGFRSAIDAVCSGKRKIIIVRVLANNYIESTGRFGMELGYHVTPVKDAMAAFSRKGDACGA